MKVELLTRNLAEQEYNAAYGMLICHANTNKLQNAPASTFIKRAMKAKHDSILEHINLTFEVQDLSRACLQELARHRHISLSVKSTRHTLIQQARADEIIIYLPEKINPDLKEIIIDYLQRLIEHVKANPDISNDDLKYAFPECLCTTLCLTCNVRELRHIFELRTSPAALQEFKNLCLTMYLSIPTEYQYLVSDCMY